VIEIPQIAISASTYLRDMEVLLHEQNFIDLLLHANDTQDPIAVHKFVIATRCRKLGKQIEKLETECGSKLSFLQLEIPRIALQLFVNYLYFDTLNELPVDIDQIALQSLYDFSIQYELP